MIHYKGTPEYRSNLDSMYEMEEVVPMTSVERASLRSWVKAGHDLESNPWHYFHPDLEEMNFLQARRILLGASHGSWDVWEFEAPVIYDEFSKTYSYP